MSLNLLLRGSAVGVLVLLATVVECDPAPSIRTRLGAFFSVSLAAATLAGMPGLPEVPFAWRLTLAALAPGCMFVFWLFTRALFDDSFAPRASHALVWLALAAAGVAGCGGGSWSVPAPWVAVLRTALGVLPTVWALLSIVQSVSDWHGDLVEGRRRLRTLVVSATALYTVAQLLVASLSGLSLRAVAESTANAGGTAVLTSLVVWRLVRLRHDGLFGAETLGRAAAAVHPYDSTASTTPPDAGPAPVRPEPTPLDARHIAALDALMTVDHLYREPDLTIGALARHMALPEHKLRRLINQGLGHRNFTAFLNAYRLADARRWLADPAQRETPILTIAMDAGYQSIGPFNRAFKADTGSTPTEFRRAGGQGASHQPTIGLAGSGIG